MREQDTSTLNAIAERLLTNVGLNYGGERLPLLASHVYRRMKALNLTSAQAYYARLLRDAEEWQRLINAVSVTESAFYRLPEVVNAVEQLLLALHRARAPGQPLVVWSAATGEGQEAYTLAMAALNAGVPALRPVQVWGTDVNTEALARARTGWYDRSDVARLPAEWQRRYLRCDDRNGCTPVEAVRQLVRFAPFNLVDLLKGVRPPFTPDIIVCANVLIYFPADMAQAVMQALAALLPPDGAVFFDRAVAYLARQVLEPVAIGPAYGYRARSRERVPSPRGCDAPPPPAPKPRPARATRVRTSSRRTALALKRGEIEWLLNTRRWDEAERRLRDWAAHAPLDVRPYVWLARLYRMRQDWQKARRFYEHALYLQPSLAVAHLEYGHVLRTLGETEAARRAYERALRAAGRDTASRQFGFSPNLIRRLAQRALEEIP